LEGRAKPFGACRGKHSPCGEQMLQMSASAQTFCSARSLGGGPGMLNSGECASPGFGGVGLYLGWWIATIAFAGRCFYWKL